MLQWSNSRVLEKGCPVATENLNPQESLKLCLVSFTLSPVPNLVNPQGALCAEIISQDYLEGTFIHL